MVKPTNTITFFAKLLRVYQKDEFVSTMVTIPRELATKLKGTEAKLTIDLDYSNETEGEKDA